MSAHKAGIEVTSNFSQGSTVPCEQSEAFEEEFEGVVIF